jgi:hypothetical protein
VIAVPEPPDIGLIEDLNEAVDRIHALENAAQQQIEEASARIQKLETVARIQRSQVQLMRRYRYRSWDGKYATKWQELDEVMGVVPPTRGQRRRLGKGYSLELAPGQRKKRTLKTKAEI